MKKKRIFVSKVLIGVLCMSLICGCEAGEKAEEMDVYVRHFEEKDVILKGTDDLHQDYVNQYSVN